MVTIEKKFDDDRKKIIIGKLDDGEKMTKIQRRKNDQAKKRFYRRSFWNVL